MNRLQKAMENADLEELDMAADEIGREAVQIALAAPQPDPAIEAQRQRDQDAALADAIEVVARQRQRLGRRGCSQHDGKTVRAIFELLRGLLADTSDAGFP
jgi:hypothetical protein